MQAFQRISRSNIIPESDNKVWVDEYRKELKRVINELLPKRNSQKDTETYYKKLLWPYGYTEHTNKVPKKDNIFSYYLEIEDEGKYHIEIPRSQFLDSLKLALLNDTIQFGYIYNILEYGVRDKAASSLDEELLEARRRYPKPEDIKYAIDFDIDDIRSKGKGITPREERLKYYKGVLEKSQAINDDCSSIKEKVEISISIMISELERQIEKDEIRLVKGMPYIPAQIPTFPPELIYFNIWGKDFKRLQKQALASTMKSDEIRSMTVQSNNSDSFVNKISPFFVDFPVGTQHDAELDYAETKEELDAMYKDFQSRVAQCYAYDFSSTDAVIRDWCREAKRCIDRAFYKGERTIGSPDRVMAPNIPAYERMYLALGRIYFMARNRCDGLCLNSIMACAYNPHRAIMKVVPYNLWGSDFPALVERVEKIPSPDEDDLPIVYWPRNYQAFSTEFDRRLMDAEIEECDHMSSEEQTAPVFKWVHGLVNDYWGRLLAAGINDKETLRFAASIWTWMTEGLAGNVIEHEQKVVMCEHYYNEPSDDHWYKKFQRRLSFCRRAKERLSRLISVIQEDLYQVIDKIQPQSTDDGSGQGRTSTTTSSQTGNNAGNSVGTVFKQKYSTIDNTTINVKVIYDFIKQYVATKLTEDDFRDAIYTADFSALLADGKANSASDYCLCIITKIKEHFDGAWYAAACLSVKKPAAKVSGYHRDHTMAKIHMRFPTNLTL